MNDIQFVLYACTPGACVPNKDRPMSTLLGAMVRIWMWAHRNNVGVLALFEHSAASQITNCGVWGLISWKGNRVWNFYYRNLQTGCHSPHVTIFSQVSKCIWGIYASKNETKNQGVTQVSEMTWSWALTFYPCSWHTSLFLENVSSKSQLVTWEPL